MSERYGPEFASLDDAFVAIMDMLLHEGGDVAPRELLTRELSPFAFSITQPRRRFVSVPERRWSIAYALGELTWHLRGSDLVEDIAFYAPRWRKIANGRKTIAGSSYGATIFARPDGRPSQWDRALALLRQDASSRRAVLYFSTPDADTKDPDADIACALSLQFLVRSGRLEAICTMRSNDAVLGMPYDVFLFTMLQELAATALGYQLGSYHHQVGSLHLYASHIELAQRVVASRADVLDSMAPMGDLSEVGLLLDGEAQYRLRLEPTTNVDTRGSYWSDLLEVIKCWTDVRADAGRKEPPKLSDPVLSALFAQWYLSPRE